VIARIEELMKHDTAGDPMTGLKWTHKTEALVKTPPRTRTSSKMELPP